MGDPSLQGRKYHAYLPYLRHGGTLWFSWLSAQAPSIVLPFNSGAWEQPRLDCWLRSALLLDRTLLLWLHVTGQRAEPGRHHAVMLLVRGHPIRSWQKRQVKNEGKIKKNYKAWTKQGCSIFSKGQAVLWLVRKRRWFPWHCNNSINQSWALQKWYLAFFFFRKVQDKILLFKTGSGKMERIPSISLIPRKVGPSNSENMLTYFSKVQIHFLGHGPANYLGKAQLFRFGTTPSFILFLISPSRPLTQHALSL